MLRHTPFRYFFRCESFNYIAVLSQLEAVEHLNPLLADNSQPRTPWGYSFTFFLWVFEI